MIHNGRTQVSLGRRLSAGSFQNFQLDRESAVMTPRIHPRAAS